MPSKTIHFVTDSTADIPAELVERHQIGIVPCFVNYDGQSFADDGVQLDREAFYQQMDKMNDLPSTAAPPPAVAEEVIMKAAENADHVVIITAAANLSGIHNSMRLASQKLPEGKVTLLDSGTASMGLGWQVVMGAEAAEDGELDEVLDTIQKVRFNQRIYAAIATMKYLQAGGRVGWAAANIGALLNIKPIIQLKGDGEINAVARVRTFKKATKEMEGFLRGYAPLHKLAILHSGNLDGAQAMQESLADVAPADTVIVNVTTTIGTHVGPGCLGVAFVSESWGKA